MMAEERWLGFTDPEEMLRWAGARASARKLRLFGVACCRRAWHLMDERCQTAILVAEAFADQRATLRRANQAREDAIDQLRKRYVVRPSACSPLFFDEQFIAAEAAVELGNPFQAARTVARALATERVHEAGIGNSTPAELDQRLAVAIKQERGNQCTIVRELFFNPFETAPFVGPWVSSEVFSLAEKIDSEGSLHRMPELADSLERMGCMDRDVLNHCRGPGPHFKGCWVVDLLLGKG